MTTAEAKQEVHLNIPFYGTVPLEIASARARALVAGLSLGHQHYLLLVSEYEKN